MISWRQSKTAGETHRDNIVVRQHARSNNGILAADNPVSNTTNTENNSEIKKEVEERQLHRVAKVHNFWEMWQGSQNLRATQNESRAQNKLMTAVGYNLDTQEIAKASLSLFQHDGVTAFELSERSHLPPGLSTKDLAGEWTQILKVRCIRIINCHSIESDDNSAPESISDPENWLNCNGDLDNLNDSEDNCAADDESDIERNNGIKELECIEQYDVSATPNVPGLVQPIPKSKRLAEKVLVTVNAIETRRNKGVKKK